MPDIEKKIEKPIEEKKVDTLPTEAEIKEALKGVDLTSGEPEIVVNKENDMFKTLVAEVKAEVKLEKEEKITMTKDELKALIRETITSTNHISAPNIPVVNKPTTIHSQKLDDSKQKALDAILAIQKKTAK